MGSVHALYLLGTSMVQCITACSDVLTEGHPLQQCNDACSALYNLDKLSGLVLSVDEVLPGHAHNQTPAHAPKASSKLIGGGVPQRFGVKSQENDGCQSLHTSFADIMTTIAHMTACCMLWHDVLSVPRSSKKVGRRNNAFCDIQIECDAILMQRSIVSDKLSTCDPASVCFTDNLLDMHN